MQYRADIDGLRGIAVLAVLFFHTQVPGFSGGYVGVDVFFVISGYLITSILLKEVGAGRFSIVRFYERRVRRIFPALFPVMAVVFALGAFLFEPNAFKGLGKSIVATTMFGSNILFWREAGYFAAPSLEKPLLHTWSLAVEEQFYIVFPLALMLIARWLTGRYRLFVVIAFLLSFGASVYGVAHYPGATFYLVPTRSWELLAGSLLALGVLPDLSGSLPRNLAGFAGLLLISASVLLYTESTPFPGVAAVAPVMGSMLLIWSGRGGGTHMAQKLLTVRPLVFIGLISYSLYLWHWPLVAFWKYLMLRPWSAYDSISIIVASISLASFSWRFIEQPFRGRQPWLSGRRTLFLVAGIVMMASVSVGFLVWKEQGMAWRFPDTSLISMQGRWQWKEENVYGRLEADPAHVQPGRLGVEDVEPSFLLWGDSHAMAIIPAIDAAAKKHSLAGLIATHSNAPAIQGIQHLDEAHSYFDLALLNENVLGFIKRHPEIKVVLLAARWSSYFPQPKDLSGNVEDGLAETVRELKSIGKRVVLVCDYPTLKNYDSPRVFYLNKRFPGVYRDPLESVDVPTVNTHRALNGNACDYFRALSGKYGVEVFVQDSPLFDSAGNGIVSGGGIPFYRDASHLSTTGSLALVTVYDQFFTDWSDRGN